MNKLNPFNKVSKTQFGAVVALLGFVAIQFGFATQGELSELVALSAQALGIIGVMLDRVSKRDINVLGIRRQ